MGAKRIEISSSFAVGNANIPRSMRDEYLLGVICLFLIVLTAPAFAERPMLEEIIVTAQKRSESLQDVPVSLSVVTGEKIEEANLVNLEELSLSVPNLFIAENVLGSYIMIRGIGSQHNQGIEQSVAIFSDGIYRGRTQQNRAPFLDVGRIEVLRGPQSILFGKNTVGGAINLNSALPTDDFQGSASLLYGRFKEQEAQLILSGPLTDKLSARLALRDYHRDGYLHNVTLDRQDPEQDDQAARIIFRWDIDDRLSARIRYEHNNFETIGSPTQNATSYPFDLDREVANDGGQTLLKQGLFTEDYIRNTHLDKLDGEFSKTKLGEMAAQIDYEADSGTLTAITGWTFYDSKQNSDADLSEVPLINVAAVEEFEQLSQEIRFSSATGGSFDWIGGIYIQQSKINFHENDYLATNLLTIPNVLSKPLIPEEFASLLDPGLIENAVARLRFDQQSSTQAIFAQGTWHIRDDFRTTVGLRFSHEEKRARQQLTNTYIDSYDNIDCTTPPGPADMLLGGSDGIKLAIQCQLLTGYLTPVLASIPLPEIQELAASLLNLGSYAHVYDQKRSENQISPMLNVEYDWNEDIMLYASATKGFKGGGYDARILLDKERADAIGAAFEFDSENAVAYEVGGKFSFGGVAELNIAMFHTTIKDLQVSQFDGRTGFVVGNAAELITQGVEIDGRTALTEHLTLATSIAYLDAHFGDYPTGGCTAAQFVAYEQQYGTRNGCTQELTGEPPFLAPEWTAGITTQYLYPVTDLLSIGVALDINYRDKYFLDADNDPGLVQPAYTLYNVRLEFGATDRKWWLSLIGKNLSNEIYAGNGSDIPLTDGDFVKMTSPPRSYAAQFSYQF